MSTQTISYNPENWVSDSAKVTLNNTKKTFSTKYFKGSWEELEPEFVRVIIEEYEHCPIPVFKEGNNWVAGRNELYRENENPVIAALKVAHNIF